MSWADLKKLVDAKDGEGAVRWLDSNLDLLNQQIAIERVRAIFRKRDLPVGFSSDPYEPPRYSHDCGVATVGAEWSCSDEFFNLLISRSLYWDYRRDFLIFKETLRFRLDITETEREGFDSYTTLNITCDPEHECVAYVEVRLIKDLSWFMTVPLTKFSWPRHHSLRDVKVYAKRQYLNNRDELFQEAKRQYEAGVDSHG
jgi:hypothetical protein